MRLTKEQTSYMERQPFNMDDVLERTGFTKKFTNRLLLNLGEALIYADKARQRGESDDTEFELNFWDGRDFMSTDDMFEESLETEDQINDCALVQAYDEDFDATFTIGRDFIACRYEFKDEEYGISVWTLRP